MKKIITSLLVGVTPMLFAQVLMGDNSTSVTTPHASAALDLRGTDKKGFVTPRINLKDRYDDLTISHTDNDGNTVTTIEGMIVYHPNDSADPGFPAGYYYYDGIKWKSLQSVSTLDEENSDEVSPNILGYYPSGVGRAALDQISVGGITATKKTCYKYQYNVSTAPKGNNHSYCGYDLSSTVTWLQAYEITKALDGYLVTFTTDDRWDFVKNKTNLLTTASTNSANRIWLGFNRVTYPYFMNNVNREVGALTDNANAEKVPEYFWVSGQEATVNWNNDAKELNYPQWETRSDWPKNIQKVTGVNLPDYDAYRRAPRCGYIKATSVDSNRQWGVKTCLEATANYLIVEFLN